MKIRMRIMWMARCHKPLLCSDDSQIHMFAMCENTKHVDHWGWCVATRESHLQMNSEPPGSVQEC